MIIQGPSKDQLIKKLHIGGKSTGSFGGGGSSTRPLAIGTSGGNALSFYGTSATTSNDSRLNYSRFYLTGAGGSGECHRVFTTVSAAVANAHGQHTSLSFGSSPSAVTGQGIGHRNTLQIPNRAVAANGNYHALQGELYCDGTSSDISPATTHSILRLLVDGGNTTTRGKVKNLMSIENAGVDGTGHMIYTHTHTPGDAAGSLRFLVNGAAVYLKFYAAE